MNPQFPTIAEVFGDQVPETESPDERMHRLRFVGQMANDITDLRAEVARLSEELREAKTPKPTKLPKFVQVETITRADGTTVDAIRDLETVSNLLARVKRLERLVDGVHYVDGVHLEEIDGLNWFDARTKAKEAKP